MIRLKFKLTFTPIGPLGPVLDPLASVSTRFGGDQDFPNRVAIAVGNREAILVVNLHFSRYRRELTFCFNYRGVCKLSDYFL